MYLCVHPSACTGASLCCLSKYHNGHGPLTRKLLIVSKDRVGLVKALMHCKNARMAFIDAVTDGTQRKAEANLKWAGFESSKRMRSMKYGRTVKIWYYPVQEFDETDPKFERYTKQIVKEQDEAFKE